ncbi:hypothetical protein GCM10023185_03640 [Hymenobacter saemangeumensis]|uniref:Secretion system C-terminal sorting domain-containing protein n=1 Tax=Hymenobacter saemangeumensis TaxID=1084522 RepID=A0ABP8HZN3_9BACT
MVRPLLFLFGSLLTLTARAQTPAYNFYYGNLHSHTSYSDGNQDEATSGASTPADAYAFADASLQMDFLGVSEHNHSQAGMQRSNYALGLQQAAQATNPQFVALFGMEWGVISGGGHMLVYGVNQLLNWEAGNLDVFVPRNDYQALMRQINRRPGAFALFAHPANLDYGDLAGAAPFSPTADSAVVGTPLRSGPATSTNVTYSNNSTSSFESTYQRMLARGYHVGMGFDHDNHNTTFGRSTAGRLVVLAPTLTQASIMQAMRERRFYGSDDWNVQVTLSCNGAPMGSILTSPAPAALSVTVSDPDNESIRSITLMRGVPGSLVNAVSVATSTTGAAALSYTDPAPSGTAYYYAIIIQADGNRIVTSPIWYTRSAVVSAATVAANPLAFEVFPNPTPGTDVTISYYLQHPAAVSLEVIDVLGRKVYALSQNEVQASGPKAYTLPATGLPAGIYTIRLTQDGVVTHRKLVVSY